MELGLPAAEVATSFAKSRGVKGRSEVIPTGRNFTIVCDYAHTPDGLDNVLPALKKKRCRAAFVTLFGCGGDRDRTKRPLMGESAALHSDFVIVTSDNPRTENPGAIIGRFCRAWKNTARLMWSFRIGGRLFTTLSVMHSRAI